MKKCIKNKEFKVNQRGGLINMKKIINGEEYVKFNNKLELEKWVKKGGWKNIDEFYSDVGLDWEEIKNNWFNITDGRLYLIDNK